MSEHFFGQAKFLLSAPKLKYLPKDEGIEVAFLGRSNAGKSSAINALVKQQGLAKTSKTPGRTAALNIFSFDDERRLVDVPGFGYAKVSLQMKEQWRLLINQYLTEREALKGVVLVMDVRHPLKPQDQHLLSWLKEAKLNSHIILTKADKLKYGEQQRVLQEVKKNISDDVSVTLFSAKSKNGLLELREKLSYWYLLKI